MTSIAGQDWFSDGRLQRVFQLLNGDGGEVRIVGGAVRNSLMGLAPGDIDLATTLVPETVVARATAAGLRAVPTGIAHGTVTLIVDGTPFEVTTLRRDVSTDGRHAEVAFGTDWTADAERRDLTINALYADASGTVIDPVGGLSDISTRTVRFIGDAGKRIAEDHLRILRFFRFFALYGSGRPDADALRACARARESLAALSAERVWSETKKLLAAPDPGRALLWMRTAGVLTAILPESEKWGIDAIPGLVATERALGWLPNPLLRLAAMVPPDRERLAAMAARLRLSKQQAAFLDEWAGAPVIKDGIAETAFARLLYRHGTGGISTKLRLAIASARNGGQSGDAAALISLASLTRLLERAGHWRRPDFPLSGSDVLAAGVPAGPRVGASLGALETAWVDSNFTMSRTVLLERLALMLSS